MEKSAQSSKFSKAFTLVELLIVIAIIGILAGAILVVINPVAQREKSAGGVVQANLAKICQAYAACISGSPTGSTAECDTAAEIGVIMPTTPTGAAYGWCTAGVCNSGSWWGYIPITQNPGYNFCVYNCHPTTAKVYENKGATNYDCL